MYNIKYKCNYNIFSKKKAFPIIIMLQNKSININHNYDIFCKRKTQLQLEPSERKIMVLNVKSKINLKTSFSSNQTISQFYRYIALE